MTVAQAGWFDDPGGVHQARYWDGTNWTERVATGGTEHVAPAFGAWPPPSVDPRVSAPISPADPPAFYRQPQYVRTGPPPFYRDQRGQIIYSADPPAAGWFVYRNQWYPPGATPHQGFLSSLAKLPPRQMAAIGGAIVIVIIGLVVIGALTNRDHTLSDGTSVPSSAEVDDMQCGELNSVVDETGAALGFQPDGSVQVPPGLTQDDTRELRRVLADVGDRVDELGGCSEQPNFAEP